MKLTELPIELIDNGERYRQDFGDLEELAKDIKKNGLICPIAVQETDGKYTLVAGERRLTAVRSLGYEKIAVRLYDRELSEYDMRILELSENLNRKAMTYAEDVALKARIHDLYVEQFGVLKKEEPEQVDKQAQWQQKDTAKTLNTSTSTLSRDLKLAKAIKLMPELAHCKDKKDAISQLNKLEKKQKRYDHAKRVSDEVHADNRDMRKQTLMDSYIVRDFFEAADEMDSGIFNLIEVDPPYGIDLINNKKENTCDDYNEVDAKKYKMFLRKTFTRSYKLMAEHGWLICWFAPHPWFDVVLNEIKRAGFTAHGMCGIWTKPSGQTHQPTVNLANAYEMFFYARKGKPKLNKEGRINIYDYKPVSPNMKTHPTERPVDMIKDVVETFAAPGSKVLVPFAGSGATLIAAARAHMNVVGFDLSHAYKDSYVLRVASELFL